MNTPGDLDSIERYARQARFAPLGEQGQRRLLAGRVLVCGCGALGSVLANTLARAGVGMLRIVDRDFLELNNLQRQVLYDEQDVAAGLPKAIAAVKRLQHINSSIQYEPVVEDVSYHNIDALASDVDVILDGTDNFETRLLLNDYAVSHGKPWVYGGCIGAEGQTMTILPGETACLGCILPDVPPPGTTPTCDTAGVLGSIVNIVASLQAVEGIKILAGHREAVSRQLTIVEIWDNRLRQIDLAQLRGNPDCLACRGEFPWLRGERGSQTAILCGRNAVQLSADRKREVNLPDLAGRLDGVGRLQQNDYLLRLFVDAYVITLFSDGRAIVGGTDDPAVARTVFAKYVGN